MIILDGKKTANDIKEEIALEVTSIVSSGGKVPHLSAILVGSDGASETYVRAKVKACEKVGFDSTLVRFDKNVTEQELLIEIDKMAVMGFWEVLKNLKILKAIEKKALDTIKNKNIEYYKLDSTSEKNIKSLSRFILKKYKRLDVLVNCIGICFNKEAEKVKKKEWDKVINININSMFYVCKEFGKIFIKQRS